MARKSQTISRGTWTCAFRDLVTSYLAVGIARELCRRRRNSDVIDKTGASLANHARQDLKMRCAERGVEIIYINAVPHWSRQD